MGYGRDRLHHDAGSAPGHRLGLSLLRGVPHSLPPPKKICVFLYSQIAGCLAVAGISFDGFRVALVVTLFFVYTAQHG